MHTVHRAGWTRLAQAPSLVLGACIHLFTFPSLRVQSVSLALFPETVLLRFVLFFELGTINPFSPEKGIGVLARAREMNGQGLTTSHDHASKGRAR